MPSCVGCKFLFGNGEGYSNYTWMTTETTCAINANPKLPAEAPYDWPHDDPAAAGDDRWKPTANGRCERYAIGPYITIDPDREDHPSASTEDHEQIAAILASIGRSDWTP